MKHSTKKADAFGNIAIKFLKEVPDAGNVAFKTIWRFRVLEKTVLFAKLEISWCYTNLQKKIDPRKDPNLSLFPLKRGGG